MHFCIFGFVDIFQFILTQKYKFLKKFSIGAAVEQLHFLNFVAKNLELKVDNLIFLLIKFMYSKF